MMKKHLKHSINATCDLTISTSLKQLLKKTFEPTKENPNITKKKTKLTVKKPENVNGIILVSLFCLYFEHIQHFVQVFLFLTLNM